MDVVQAGSAYISLIEHVERSGPIGDEVHLCTVTCGMVGYHVEYRQVAVYVIEGMNLDSALSFMFPAPSERPETEIYGRGVERVQVTVGKQS